MKYSPRRLSTAWAFALPVALLALAALAALTSGCASLPDVKVNAGSGGTAVVALNGPRSALSAAQVKTVVAGLSSDEEGAEAVDRHLKRETALAGSPLTAGNAVTLLQDGPAT